MSTSAAASPWFLRTVALLGIAALGELVTGCGTGDKTTLPSAANAIPRALVLEARPIGRGTRFTPPAAGRVPGRCVTRLGDRVGVST